jgi:hypothetical protein
MHIQDFIGIWIIVGLLVFIVVNRIERNVCETFSKIVACLLICTIVWPYIICELIKEHDGEIADFLNRPLYERKRHNKD